MIKFDNTQKGILAAVIGNVINGISQTLQKQGIDQIEQNKKIKKTIFSRLLNKFWLIGFVLNYIGEGLGNYVAISYCSPALVTPLGIIGVIVNSLSAYKLLKEPFTKNMLIGYIWIIFGVIGILYGVPKQELNDLNSVINGNFKLVLLCGVSVSLVQSFRIYRYRLRNLVNCVILTCAFATNALLTSKLLSIVISSKSENDKYYVVSLIIFIIVNAICQEFSRQYALTHIKVQKFQPVMYACFVSVSVIQNVLVFSQYQNRELYNFVILFIGGVLCIAEGCWSLLHENEQINDLSLEKLSQIDCLLLILFSYLLPSQCQFYSVFSAFQFFPVHLYHKMPIQLTTLTRAHFDQLTIAQLKEILDSCLIKKYRLIKKSDYVDATYQLYTAINRPKIDGNLYKDQLYKAIRIVFRSILLANDNSGIQFTDPDPPKATDPTKPLASYYNYVTGEFEPMEISYIGTTAQQFKNQIQIQLSYNNAQQLQHQQQQVRPTQQQQVRPTANHLAQIPSARAVNANSSREIIQNGHSGLQSSQINSSSQISQRGQSVVSSSSNQSQMRQTLQQQQPNFPRAQSSSIPPQQRQSNQQNSFAAFQGGNQQYPQVNVPKFQFLISPFVKIKARISANVAIRQGTKPPAKSCFTLDQRFVQQLLETKNNSDIKYVVLLTCCRADALSYSNNYGNHKNAPSIKMDFPNNAELFVNSKLVKDFKSNVKSGKAIDITEYILPNLISDPKNSQVHCHLGWDNAQAYFIMALWLGVKVSVKHLSEKALEIVNYVDENGIKLNVTEQIEVMTKFFNRRKSTSMPTPFNSNAGFLSDDDELMSRTCLSLRDPLTLTSLKTPIRGINCNHLQTFDLETWILMNENTQNKFWKCPVCTKDIRRIKTDFVSVPLSGTSVTQQQIVVKMQEVKLCEYIKSIIDKVEEQKKDLDSVNIYVDSKGIYSIEDDTKRGISSDEEEEEEQYSHQPTLVEKDSRVIDLVSDVPSSDSHVIDLTLSDDD